VRRRATQKAAFAVALLCLALAALAQAEETIRKGTLQISFDGKIVPRKLPRVGAAPVAVSFSADITTTDRSAPPQLRRIVLAINRNGRLDRRGLPSCRFRQIQPASIREAREACPGSVVGNGTFKANVALPEQSPYPSNGKILAFNGTYHGKPVIFAHIYGTQPLPTSFTLPFELKYHSKGTYGIVLAATLPSVAADWGYVSGVSLTLQRQFRDRGKAQSYISAGCPAPKGFPGASFSLVKAALGFADGKTLRTTMTRNCWVRR
jgi:hypothetical protein